MSISIILKNGIMKFKIDDLKLGLILGILAPVLTMIAVYWIKFSVYDFKGLIDFLVAGRLFTKIVSLCVIPNLALFFFFLNKNYYRSAKGILTATFIFAIFVFVTKFAL